MGDVSRLQVGSPYGSFFGLMRNGVFQNQTEINSYVDKMVIRFSRMPRDFRWVDANGDGKINTDDYTYLGNSFLSLHMA